jgi:hypothetical protein
MVVTFAELLEVVITLIPDIWLPPSTNKVAPSGEIARFTGAAIAIGGPTSVFVPVSTSTTWFAPVSAT